MPAYGVYRLRRRVYVKRAARRAALASAAASSPVAAGSVSAEELSAGALGRVLAAARGLLVGRELYVYDPSRLGKPKSIPPALDVALSQERVYPVLAVEPWLAREKLTDRLLEESTGRPLGGDLVPGPWDYATGASASTAGFYAVLYARMLDALNSILEEGYEMEEINAQSLFETERAWFEERGRWIHYNGYLWYPGIVSVHGIYTPEDVKDAAESVKELLDRLEEVAGETPPARPAWREAERLATRLLGEGAARGMAAFRSATGHAAVYIPVSVELTPENLRHVLSAAWAVYRLLFPGHASRLEQHARRLIGSAKEIAEALEKRLRHGRVYSKALRDSARMLALLCRGAAERLGELGYKRLAGEAARWARVFSDLASRAEYSLVYRVVSDYTPEKLDKIVLPAWSPANNYSWPANNAWTSKTGIARRNPYVAVVNARLFTARIMATVSNGRPYIAGVEITSNLPATIMEAPVLWRSLELETYGAGMEDERLRYLSEKTLLNMYRTAYKLKPCRMIEEALAREEKRVEKREAEALENTLWRRQGSTSTATGVSPG